MNVVTELSCLVRRVSCVVCIVRPASFIMII